MKNVIDLHKEAMEFAAEAMLLDLQGDTQRAYDVNRQAFLKEKQAADLMSNSYEIEPTRSVLYRSAATLALKCGETTEAKSLIALALAGNPPTEIVQELQDLLGQVDQVQSLKDQPEQVHTPNDPLNQADHIPRREPFSFQLQAKRGL